MAKCGACGKFISAAAAECIRCNKCNMPFHKACVAIPETATVKSWMCPGCKVKVPRENNTSTPVKGICDNYKATSSPPALDDTTHNITEESKVDLALELRSFRSELSALRAEVHDWRIEIAELKSMFKTYDEKFTTLEDRISVLEKNMQAPAPGVGPLENAIAALKSQLNDKDQELFSNDIDLSGIPERNGESVMNVLSALSVKLGVEFDERDVVRAERVGCARRNRIAVSQTEMASAAAGTSATVGVDSEQQPRIITVRFARQITRDKWLSRRVCVVYISE